MIQKLDDKKELTIEKLMIITKQVKKFAKPNATNVLNQDLYT